MSEYTLSLVLLLVFVVIIGFITIPHFFHNNTRPPIARAEADMRAIRMALNTNYLENKNYPFINDKESNSLRETYFLSDDKKVYLTTPIAYLSSFPSDPFRKTIGNNISYEYASNGQNYFILTSYGPDRKDGLAGVKNGELDERHYTGAKFNERDKAGLRGSKFLLSEYLYDPSNGISSSGDIIILDRHEKVTN